MSQDPRTSEMNGTTETFPLNLTDAFGLLDSNATEGATPSDAANVTYGSRGGGVQGGDPGDFGNDAAWILTATFIIFTMQSGEPRERVRR